jgi:hypothetical protein
MKPEEIQTIITSKELILKTLYAEYDATGKRLDDTKRVIEHYKEQLTLQQLGVL